MLFKPESLSLKMEEEKKTSSIPLSGLVDIRYLYFRFIFTSLQFFFKIRDKGEKFNFPPSISLHLGRKKNTKIDNHKSLIKEPFRDRTVGDAASRQPGKLRLRPCGKTAPEGRQSSWILKGRNLLEENRPSHSLVV